MRNGVMPKVQPDAAIEGKKHQSIRRLDTHILKINTQTHRKFKHQFIQRFPSFNSKWPHMGRATRLWQPRGRPENARYTSLTLAGKKYPSGQPKDLGK
jgi:hypothetical protein